MVNKSRQILALSLGLVGFVAIFIAVVYYL